MNLSNILLPLVDDPEGKQLEALLRHDRRMERLTRPLRRVPLVGSVVQTFWYCILTEGVYQTCKPRWGALTFSFLNDGLRPTLWHTWRQITHDHADPYTGIYVRGAPRSLKQAQEWEAEWAAKREVQR